MKSIVRWLRIRKFKRRLELLDRTCESIANEVYHDWNLTSQERAVLARRWDEASAEGIALQATLDLLEKQGKKRATLPTLPTLPASPARGLR
jgi:hypothetical protein